MPQTVPIERYKSDLLHHQFAENDSCSRLRLHRGEHREPAKRSRSCRIAQARSSCQRRSAALGKSATPAGRSSPRANSVADDQGWEEADICLLPQFLKTNHFLRSFHNYRQKRMCIQCGKMDYGLMFSPNRRMSQKGRRMQKGLSCRSCQGLCGVR